MNANKMRNGEENMKADDKKRGVGTHNEKKKKNLPTHQIQTFQFLLVS